MLRTKQIDEFDEAGSILDPEGRRYHQIFEFVLEFDACLREIEYPRGQSDDEAEATKKNASATIVVAREG